MLSSILIRLILNQYLIYSLSIFILILLLILLYNEFWEYRIKRDCKQQNLQYVRLPSQTWAILRKQRFDIVETNLIKRYGKVFGSNMLSQMTIYVADAELAQIVCNREFTKFANRRIFTLEDPIWDNLLFSTNDEKWKRLRAIMSPAFATGKLRKFKYCIDETFKTMAKNLDRIIKIDPIINVKEVVGAFTMDTIIQISMGIKMDSLQDPNSRLIQYARKLFGQDVTVKDTIIFLIAFFYPKLLKFLNLRFQGEALDYFKKCVIDILDKKRQEIKQQKQINHKATNFIELILEVQEEQEKSSNDEMQNGVNAMPFKHITDDELIAQCITFFTVGYDTTATTITNTCYTLATNPDKQEKLYENIMETLEQLKQESNYCKDDPFELITFDTLSRFEYLTAVLNETMRFLTLLAATERLAMEDCRLETSDKKLWFNVRKGDVIRISMINLHMDPCYFSRPNEFIPERFLSKQQSNQNVESCNKMAFIPFGSGPRKCIATNLALLEAKMALIHLFRMYRMYVDDKKTKIPLNFYVNQDLLIAKDVYLRVEKRC